MFSSAGVCYSWLDLEMIGSEETCWVWRVQIILFNDHGPSLWNNAHENIYIFISSNLRSVGEFGVCLYVWQKYSHCPSLTEVLALLFAQYSHTAEIKIQSQYFKHFFTN